VTETFTTPAGLTLSYERRGSGPLLVCHPGGPGGSAAEFRDFAGLDDTFELVLLSPRGSHGSDAADDYALTSYVADLEALRQHLALDQLDLLGFSHGGIVAMAYAAAHGERIRRLVLAATLAVWSDEAEAAMHRTMQKRRDEPWFAEAEKAIEEEQAGAFSSSDELVGNVQQQIPLYFTAGRATSRSAASWPRTSPRPSRCTTSTRSSSRRSIFAPSCARSRLRRWSSPATTTSWRASFRRTRSFASCPTHDS
jgi:pimeloyl-ACP methyl ester carboxylesterase